MTTDEADRIMGAVELVRGEVRALRIDFNGRVKALEQFRAFAIGVATASTIALGSMAAWIGLTLR